MNERSEITQRSSKESHVASDRETVRRLSGDLALARNCLSNLLFAESALDKELARREARRFLGHPPTEHAHETLPPRITVMNDGRAMGGSDVCHTCEAHCTVINDLQTALRGLYWDNVDYLRLNKLGGMQNHWMSAARMALGMDVNDVRPTQKASESPKET